MSLHFIPAALSFGFFVFLLLLGRAFFALTKLRMAGRATWLLSPAMGLAILGLLVGGLNQMGLPVAKFGRMLAIALTVLSLGGLWWRRCPIPWRVLSLILGGAALWLVTAGWPLLKFGNDWLSYVNNDFTNYCFGATRLLHHGFFYYPTEAEVRGGDPTAVYWFMHVTHGARPVTDFVLAAASAVSSFSPREAFMPVILTFALVQSAALGGLLALGLQSRKAAWTAAVLLLLAPMFLLGVYYQLFAQVGGLSLMLLVLALLARPNPFPERESQFLAALPCATAVAALLWFYPECAPFVLIPAALMQMMALLRQPSSRKRRLRWLLLTSLVVIVMLHINIPMIFKFLLKQTASGGTVANNDLFPYFLGMTGWTRTLGWAPFGWPAFYGPVPGLLSLLALVFILAACSQLIRRTSIHVALAGTAAVMLLMTALLFHGQNGFSLFKLAMFAQPVLAAGLALAWHLPRLLILRVIIALGWVASILPTNWDYLEFALGKPGGPCGLAFASELGFPKPSKGKGTYQTVNMGPQMEKLVTMHYERKVADPMPVSSTSLYWGFAVRPEFFEEKSLRLMKMIDGRILDYRHGLVWFDPPRPLEAPEPRYLAEPHFKLSPFNRFQAKNRKKDWFTLTKLELLENRLAWIPSASAHKDDPRRTILWSPAMGIQVEQDVADKGRTFFATGRQHLFQVVRDTPEIYLRLAFTRTYCGQGRVQLSGDAAVEGETRVPLGLMGSGSASVIVGPVRPLKMEEKALVSLDLGTAAETLFEGDSRKLSGWIRDVSAISSARFQQLARPSFVKIFPSGLLDNPVLEYSGICEDGIVDQKCWITLAMPPGEPAKLHLEGEILPMPGLEAGNGLSISVDGVPLPQVNCAPGSFECLVSLPPQKASYARFELTWRNVSRLPKGDERPVAARLVTIGVIPVK